MADDRPNIVLVVTDQQRGDCLGVDGHPVLQTPYLDFLATQGTRFSRAYSEAPTCMPGRRSLLLGQAPATHGMVGMNGPMPMPDAPTLPGVLRDAGYQTELVGKLHINGARNERFGFDHMHLADNACGGEYGRWLAQQGCHRPQAGFAHGGTSNGWVGRPHYLPQELMHTAWCVDRAMEFIEHRDQSCPFFLKLSFIDPHPPLNPPQFYYDRYINSDLPDPVVGDWVKDLAGPRRGFDPNAWDIHLDPRQMRCAQAAYFGMVNFIDDQLGRIIQMMRKNTVANTVWVFVSDHGEMLGDHHMFRKSFAYEGSARVPMFVHLPRAWGEQGPGQGLVSDAPVGLQDLMPTILDAAGVDIPDSVTGHSLLPIVRGQTDRVRDVLHGEHAGCYENDHGMQYLTDGKTKYIWYTQTGREQLFDLVNDPGELHDLAAAPDADDRLQPWRERLIDFIDGRPEGFVQDGRLKAGQPHTHRVPGYEPGWSERWL